MRAYRDLGTPQLNMVYSLNVLLSCGCARFASLFDYYSHSIPLVLSFIRSFQEHGLVHSLHVLYTFLFVVLHNPPHYYAK